MEDSEELERIRALAIPPAWGDVWICRDPAGHLQATGVDAAGRKQYLYHRAWHGKRDREKFRRMIAFARALPRLRRDVRADLDGDEPTRERVLAGATRLLDVGLFRIGGEEYAQDGGGLGLATIRKEHVRFTEEAVVFDYPAKSGVRRVHLIDDAESLELVRTLRRRRHGGDQLLAYRERGRWIGVRSDEINEYLKRHIGDEFSAKDFRTWNATVLAAAALASTSAAASTAARERAIRDALSGVAELLGNTPAVARSAYVDPRVFDRYLAGSTIAPALARIGARGGARERTRRRVERAVLRLLCD